MPDPELFADPLFMRSGDMTLFTSSVFSRHVGVFGMAEVKPGGFGISYMTGFDGMTISASHFRRQNTHVRMLLTIDYLQFTVTSSCELPTAEFAEEIRKAAEETYELFATRDQPKR